MKKFSLFFVLGATMLLLSACGTSQKAQPAETQQVTLPQSAPDSKQSTGESPQPQSSTTTDSTTKPVSFAPPSYRTEYDTKTVTVPVEKISDSSSSSSTMGSETTPAYYAPTYAPPQQTYTNDYVAYSYPQNSSNTYDPPFHGVSQNNNIPTFHGAQFHGVSGYPQYGCPNPNVYTPASYWCVQPMPIRPFHGAR